MLTFKISQRKLDIGILQMADGKVEKYIVDESKILLYGGTGSRTLVRRPRNEEYRPMYTKKRSNTEVPAL